MARVEAEAILDGDRETAVALLLRVGELIEANRRLEARVAELEQRLNRNSRDSSLPPSRDPPSAPPRPGRPASGRGRGGQPGHEGKHRPLLPLERVDGVVDHWPARCARCCHCFGEAERIDTACPQRHQLAELPPIAVTVAEHRLHRVRCPACAAETRAELPAEVPRGAFGPRLQAAAATLAVRNRVSRRDTSELVRELFGAEVSTGSVAATVGRAGKALAGPHARLRAEIERSRAVNVDETGWRTAGERRTLWGRDPGTLTQTTQLPSASTAAFRTRMDSLWRRIVADSVAAARPAFFPRAAYLQVKAIADPGADHEQRLVRGYRLDIHAAHVLVAGSGCPAAAERAPQIRRAPT